MLCDSQLYDYMWFDFKTMFDQVAKKLHIKQLGKFVWKEFVD
jgi:hypothetical protein